MAHFSGGRSGAFGGLEDVDEPSDEVPKAAYETRKAILAKVDAELSGPLYFKLCLGSDLDVFAVPLQPFPVLI